MKAMSQNSLESWSLNQVSMLKGTSSLDITTLVQNIVIEEDIEQGLIRGTLTFIDSMNITETMEMMGEDYVFISFNSFNTDLSEKAPYAKLFRIYSYMELTEQNLGTKRGVQLYFCTPAEVYNELCNIRKSYKNASSNQIVTEMLEILKVESDVFIEETLFMKDLIIPGITPLETIAFMAKTSMSKETGDSNFYFFENRDGIHFKSGVTLSKDEPFEYVVEGTSPTDMQMYHKISNYQKVKGYDVLEQYGSGASGVNMISRDALHKGYQEDAVSFDTVKEQYPMLNNSPAITPIKDVGTSKQHMITTEQMYQFNNKSAYGNMSAIREINRNSLYTKRSLIEAAGDSNVGVGMIIDLKISNQNGQASVRDSGKWLISKCRHVIDLNIGRYTQEMDIISDSNITREI